VALPDKWGSADRDVLPAWVAEMDYAPPEAIVDAVQTAVADLQFGYPRTGAGGPLGDSYSAFAHRHFRHEVPASNVLPVVDVTTGVRLALEVLSDPGPVVIPMPAYPPLLELPGVVGLERAELRLDPNDPRAELDLDRLDHLLRAGARTVLLTNPHNPWGRAFTRFELEALRDLVCRHGARVISDEVHAPLVLPGAQHVPYLAIEGTGDHAIAVVSASKAFNCAGLRCAQIVTGDRRTLERLVDVPIARNDSWSSLGVVATIAAYTECDEWLSALVGRLAAQRSLFGQLLAEHLPAARARPLEATYLAWVDLRAYGRRDPATVAHTRGRVRLAPGHDFQPGLDGHVRVNLATSAERLTEAARRLAGALGASER
jgi:cystathionine beta-lyase